MDDLDRDAVEVGVLEARGQVVRARVGLRHHLAALVPLDLLGAEVVTVVQWRFVVEVDQRRIVELVREADLFYCESPFLEEDVEQASKRYHLTARQAGLLGREARVRRLEVFHFSPRYEGRADEIYAEARAAFERADPAHRDATTQFYVAYAFYRQGWGRLYSDDDLYRQGLEAVNRAISLAPRGRLVVEQPGQQIRTADELKAELEAGLRRDASDFDPRRLLRPRR